MFKTFEKRNSIFLITMLCALTFAFILGAKGTFACGKGEYKKACTHKSSKHNCPMHMKATSEAGAQEQSSDATQPLSLEAFSKMEQYTCPMHPEIREAKSGKCSKCGMRLAKKDHYLVYTCHMEGCPRLSTKPGKCCGKDLQRKITSREELYDLAQLEEEFFCPMHSEVVSDQAGKCPKCGMTLEKRTVQKESPEMMSYVCPMHPDEVSEKPRKCSKCGMKLKKEISSK